MLPALALIVLLVVGFLAWELIFAKRGQQALKEQHRVEGNDEPPTTI